MDCQTALETLDCVRPDSDDLALPEFAEARAHLVECPACAAESERRQRFDRAVCGQMEDLPVAMPDLECLLKSLHAAGGPGELSLADVSAITGTGTDTIEAATAPVHSRRNLLRWMATGLSAAVAVALTAWLWPSGPTQFAVDDLLQRVDLSLASASDFDQSFQVRTPATWSRPLSLDSHLRGMDLDDAAGHDVALAVFRFSPSRAAPVTGVLAIIPVARLKNPPETTSFARAQARYPRQESRALTAAVWREQDFVFLCFVPGSAADLERIQNSLAGSAA